VKWLTYAVAAMSVMILLTNWLDATNSVLYPVVDTLTSLVFAGIPVVAGIAALQYRLYEIDAIINRTVVYGSLTVVLALAYLGSVVSLQCVFRVLTAGG
jgi:hypothetical protein